MVTVNHGSNANMKSNTSRMFSEKPRTQTTHLVGTGLAVTFMKNWTRCSETDRHSAPVKVTCWIPSLNLPSTTNIKFFQLL